MKQCPVCGTVTEYDARFCPSDGFVMQAYAGSASGGSTAPQEAQTAVLAPADTGAVGGAETTILPAGAGSTPLPSQGYSTNPGSPPPPLAHLTQKDLSGAPSIPVASPSPYEAPAPAAFAKASAAPNRLPLIMGAAGFVTAAVVGGLIFVLTQGRAAPSLSAEQPAVAAPMAAAPLPAAPEPVAPVPAAPEPALPDPGVSEPVPAAGAADQEASTPAAAAVPARGASGDKQGPQPAARKAEASPAAKPAEQAPAAAYPAEAPAAKAPEPAPAPAAKAPETKPAASTEAKEAAEKKEEKKKKRKKIFGIF